MLERLTSALLWDKRLSPRMARIWGVLILLAPLALAGAIALQMRIASRVPVHATLDRGEAVRIARQFAEKRGFDTMGWRDSVTVKNDLKVYRYLSQQGDVGKTALEEFATWSLVLVKLEEEEKSQRVELELTPTGRIAGYSIHYGDSNEMDNEPAALKLAEAAMEEQRRAHPHLAAKDRRMSISRDGDSATSYTYTWKIAVNGIGGLQGEASVKVRAGRIVAEQTPFEVTEEVAETLGNNSLRKFTKGVTIFYAIALIIGLLVRYSKRRLQKEASQQRMYLVTFLMGSSVLGVFLLQDLNPLNTTSDQPIPFWVPLLVLTVMGYLMGLGAGVCYAAAEGDLRETYPNLLVSLDALLSGKAFSRNVGRSIVMGAALAGWTLLFSNVIYVAAASPYSGMNVMDETYNYLFSRTPWLTLLTGVLTGAVTRVLLCVLGPLTLIRRRVRQRWRLMLLLVPLGWFSYGFMSDDPLNTAMSAAFCLVQVASLVWAFFAVDLLTSLSLLAALLFLPQLVGLSMLSTGWLAHNPWSLLIPLATLAVGSVCAFWGAAVREEEVRPQYAKEIVERLQLESEVEAAREAQKRLLPAAAPSMSGLTLAASCNAADVVSGDFYDFFPIGPDRLGILVSDGGGNGLATALSIALTKGYLMHKAHAGLTPLETMRGLQATLGKEMRGVNAEGICYLVLDTRESTLRYARLGDTPSALVAGGTEPHEIQHKQEGLTLWEGYTQLTPQSRVVLYTNGLSRLIGEPDRGATNRWLLKRLNGLLQQSTEQLHDSILKVIFRKRMGRGTRKANDDVTVIVLGVDRSAAASLEHVA